MDNLIWTKGTFFYFKDKTRNKLKWNNAILNSIAKCAYCCCCCCLMVGFFLETSFKTPVPFRLYWLSRSVYVTLHSIDTRTHTHTHTHTHKHTPIGEVKSTWYLFCCQYFDWSWKKGDAPVEPNKCLRCFKHKHSPSLSSLSPLSLSRSLSQEINWRLKNSP